MERQTRQQHAVMQAIADSGRSLSPQEIWALAQQAVPRINLSTVYRQLKSLQEDGQVVRVQLPGQAPRFESAGLSRQHHAGGAHGAAASPVHAGHHGHEGQGGGHPQPHHPHHHHFHCMSCEQVFPLHACPGGIEKLAPRGYEVLSHDLTLHGRCANCVAGAAA